jgi:hypothetical protein
MFSRGRAPAKAQEVEVPGVAEKLPQLHEQIIGDMSQPEDSDVLTPALWAVGTHCVLGRPEFRRLEPRRR